MKFLDFSSSSSIKRIYIDLYKMATGILEEKLHYFTQPQLSVNIYKLATAYKIKIYDKDMINLILPSGEPAAEVLGYLNTYSGKAIYLNRNARILTRRYIIAYHLAYYLLNDGKTENYVHYLTEASLPVDIDRQLCHLLASFLLMPAESVSKLLVQYKKTFPSLQISLSSWLDYLGNAMGLPIHYASTAFEAVRTLHVFLAEERAEFLE